MGDCILVINCGSSSVKFQLMNPNSGEVLVKGLAENIGSKRCLVKYGKEEILLPSSSYENVLETILKKLEPLNDRLAGIGHRVVHGGEFFSSSTIINEEVLTRINACSHLAPLHNPANALGIEICRKKYPNLTNVAVFDTSFHMTIPNFAYLYAIPYTLYEDKKIRRYGFHGTSHRFVSEEAKTLLETSSKLVVAHLGNGASVCAVKDGKSVDTSMGFTPLEGLIMGTRSGDIDPGVLAFLGQAENKTLEEIMSTLNKESGLLGISGISGDMRLLEEMALKNDPKALLAIKMFCYRLAKYIASYQVPLGGIDGVIFTGGIGENSPLVRKLVMDFLPNFSLDEKANSDLKRGSAGIVSKKGLPQIAVIPTNEELLIAKDTISLLIKGGKAL